jgi:hypothetical protein
MNPKCNLEWIIEKKIQFNKHKKIMAYYGRIKEGGGE